MEKQFSVSVAVQQNGATTATISYWLDGTQVGTSPPLTRRALEKLINDIENWAFKFIDE